MHAGHVTDESEIYVSGTPVAAAEDPCCQRFLLSGVRDSRENGLRSNSCCLSVLPERFLLLVTSSRDGLPCRCDCKEAPVVGGREAHIKAHSPRSAKGSFLKTRCMLALISTNTDPSRYIYNIPRMSDRTHPHTPSIFRL